jgi:hypothetical protein
LLQAFQIAFKKEKDTIMVKRNYIEPNKITLARWVNKALSLTLIRKKYHIRVQRYKDLAT